MPSLFSIFVVVNVAIARKIKWSTLFARFSRAARTQFIPRPPDGGESAALRGLGRDSDPPTPPGNAVQRSDPPALPMANPTAPNPG